MLGSLGLGARILGYPGRAHEVLPHHVLQGLVRVVDGQRLTLERPGESMHGSLALALGRCVNGAPEAPQVA
jgi:hypothetical protein